MKNNSRKIIKNSIWVVSWLLINVLFSMAYRYFETMPHAKNAKTVLSILGGLADSIIFWFVGPLYGVIGGVFFLIFDAVFFRKKIKNKKLLFFIRISLIILFIFIGVLVDKFILQ